MYSSKSSLVTHVTRRFATFSTLSSGCYATSLHPASPSDLPGPSCVRNCIHWTAFLIQRDGEAIRVQRKNLVY